MVNATNYSKRANHPLLLLFQNDRILVMTLLMARQP
jgi:hypothetical protein